MRNDASAAIAAFRKGSSQSPEMQRCAVSFSQVAAANGVDIVPWHVPGLSLVAEGTDGASRDGTGPTGFGQDANLFHVPGLAAARGPGDVPSLWDSVALVASAAGWRITVDALASESNARAFRFWSRARLGSGRRALGTGLGQEPLSHLRRDAPQVAVPGGLRSHSETAGFDLSR
jgi:hypothetical protein